jgi:hypothetical protein
MTDLIPNDLSHLSDEEFLALCPQGEHAPGSFMLDFLKDYPEVTRVEVITNNGREFVQHECSNVQVSLQDNGQTIKVFLFSTYD